MNDAVIGQSVLLKEVSYLIIKGPANITFADGEGFYLYSMISAIGRPYGKYKDCPLQFINNSNNNNTDIAVNFINRHDPIMFIYSDGLSHCNESFSKYFPDTVSKYFASPPINLCICNQSNESGTNTCLTHFPSDEVFRRYPGQNLNLRLTAGNYKNESTPSMLETNVDAYMATNRTNTRVSIRQSILFLKHQCSLIEVPLLRYTPYYSNILLIWYMIPQTTLVFRVRAELLECPSGFELSTINDGSMGHCVCHSYLIKEGITRACDIATTSIGIPKQAWFGDIIIDKARNRILPSNISSNNTVFAYGSVCPVGFCNEGATSVNVLNPDSLCRPHRTGILCGACAEGYSELFTSSDCGQCSNTAILYIGAIALLGVIIVLFLFCFRVTISENYFASYFFYAATIRSSMKQDLLQTTNPLLAVSYAVLNMELGFKHCVFNGMNNLSKMALAYMLPIYIWLMVIGLILVSKRSSKVSNLTSHSSIQVLATLCYMSFAKVLRNIVITLTYASLKTPEGDYLVWYGDGNIMYWRDPWHAILMLLASAMIIVYVMPFLLWTTFCSLALHVKCIRKRRNLVDVFHGQYHDGWGWLFGARLVVLFLSQVVYVYYRSRSTITLLSLYVVLLSPLTLVQLYFKPFRNKWVNAVESFVLVDLLLVEVITLYREMTDVNETTSLHLIMGLLYVVLVLILVSLVVKVIARIKYTKLGRKVRIHAFHIRSKMEQICCLKLKGRREEPSSIDSDNDYREPLLKFM